MTLHMMIDVNIHWKKLVLKTEPINIGWFSKTFRKIVTSLHSLIQEL